jgi:hypothetical protein
MISSPTSCARREIRRHHEILLRLDLRIRDWHSKMLDFRLD